MGCLRARPQGRSEALRLRPGPENGTMIRTGARTLPVIAAPWAAGRWTGSYDTDVQDVERGSGALTSAGVAIVVQCGVQFTLRDTAPQ